MKRRDFVALLGGAAAAWPLAARAQQPADKRPLIAVLIAGSEAAYRRDLESFRGGMRQLGYSDGENIRYEYRFADGDLERLPGLAADLVRRNPNVIVSSPLAAHLAAKQATSTIPIVMASVADPVAFGLAQSLSHPGGNLTGLGNFADVLASKQLDLLRELMPRLSRVAVLVNASNPLHAPQIAATRDAVQSTQAVLLTVEIRSAAQLDDAFATLAGGRAEGLLVPPDTVFRTYRQRIAELAAAARLPAIYGYRDHVEAGGLISYGPKLEENYRRAATYVDKILKGAKPSDLPIEQPTKIELVINLKTAKALGLDVPPTPTRPRRRGDRMRRREFVSATRRRGSVAARGAGAAGGKATDHRVPGNRHAFIARPMVRRTSAAAARTRLDRGSYCRDRVSLGGGSHRALRRNRSRIRPAARSMSLSHRRLPQSSLPSRRRQSSPSFSRRRGTRSAPA